MIRRLAVAVVPILLVLASAGGCRRERTAQAPPPAPAPPPPPPPPCDVLGKWQATPPLPLGPHQIDIAPTERPGVYLVRAFNGTNLGVATVKNTTGAPVDTHVTDPIYRCAVGPDCNTLTCAFTGGVAPATFKRLP